MVYRKKLFIFSLSLIFLIFIGLSLFFLFQGDKVFIANKDNIQKENLLMNSAIEIIDTDHIFGDKDAKVKIVFYGSFIDPFSREYAGILKNLVSKFKNIAIIFRPYVSTRDFSVRTAIAAECAGEQGKYWDMYNSLFFSEVNNDKDIADIAARIGLNSSNLSKCMNDEKKLDFLINEYNTAVKLNVYGTPTTFVNKKMIMGVCPLEDYKDEEGNIVPGLETIVQDELKS